YLKRPWYESGDDELLGVVVFPADIHSITHAIELKPYVTRIGSDPIWESDDYSFGYPHPFQFTKVVQQSDKLALEEAEGANIMVMGYRVDYDSDRELWYSDVLLDPARDSSAP